MAATHTDMALAVLGAAFLSRQRSKAGTAEFRREMDQTRHTIAASRELLKRLRERHRDYVPLGWEDANQCPGAVSAFEADVLRSAFQGLLRGTGAPESQWRYLARALVHEFVGCEPIEAGLIDWIIHK